MLSGHALPVPKIIPVLNISKKSSSITAMKLCDSSGGTSQTFYVNKKAQIQITA